MTSMHYTTERCRRERIITEIGMGEVYAVFIVDRGHKDGAEKHIITTTGIISIYNARSGKLITKLIARPGQIKRYYPDGDYPTEIVSIARMHVSQHLNQI